MSPERPDGANRVEIRAGAEMRQKGRQTDRRRREHRMGGKVRVRAGSEVERTANWPDLRCASVRCRQLNARFLRDKWTHHGFVLDGLRFGLDLDVAYVAPFVPGIIVVIVVVVQSRFLACTRGAALNWRGGDAFGPFGLGAVKVARATVFVRGTFVLWSSTRFQRPSELLDGSKTPTLEYRNKVVLRSPLENLCPRRVRAQDQLGWAKIEATDS